MKNILFVHQTSAIGGGSFCMLNIIKELDPSIYNIEVLIPNEGPLCEELYKINIKVHLLNGLRGIPYNRNIYNPKFLKSYIDTFSILKHFKNFLKKHSYDIVYLNSMILYPYLRIAKSFNIKTIIHIREHWPLNEHKLQLYYTQRQVEKYADKIFAINKYSASMFPRSNYKCNIIYDWVDMTNRYEYRPFNDFFSKDDIKDLKVFLYTGGFDPIKGIKDVLSVFHNTVTDKNARLLILGEKPTNPSSKYFKECNNFIDNDSRIICIPRTYKVKHIIEQAYCVLSFYTIPHANLGLAENIILNKITIAADNEEAREYSLDGKLALLFQPNDINDFSKKIKLLDKVYNEYQNQLYQKSNIIKQMFDKNRNIKIIKCAINNLN